jgi:hypothetical protein
MDEATVDPTVAPEEATEVTEAPEVAETEEVAAEGEAPEATEEVAA